MFGPREQQTARPEGREDTKGFVTAIEQWRQLLGEAHVELRPAVLRQAERATFATDRQIVALLRPADRSQLQQLLRIANLSGIPVYPTSSGRNWGYGSRVPTADGCALIDLGRLNRIVEFDPVLGVVTIEPGVTQRQLFAYLQERGGHFWMDATGSSPDCSLIGNFMERGFGHTPYGDHFAHVSGLEVVLPTGELVRTGMGQFAGAQAQSVYRWGAGPFLDGLFSQSNFGIVTRLSLWLMPAPEYFQAFFFSVEREEQLAEIIEQLRPLRLNGTLPSAVHIGNGYKVLSSIRQYPWQEAGGRTPLPPEVLARFAREWDFGAWNGSGGLYGTRRQVAEARRLVKAALAGRVRRLRFLDERTLRLAEKLTVPYRWCTGRDLAQLLRLVVPVFDLMRGVPTASQLASTYWRKRHPVPADPDPDRDGCGLIWCAPVAPLGGRHAEAIRRIVVETLPMAGFEPLISITLLSERCLSAIVTIAYDREVAGEDERARACYERLSERLAAEGYYPYRLGIQSQSRLMVADGNRRLYTALKSALDPNNVLAPGRYQPLPTTAIVGPRPSAP